MSTNKEILKTQKWYQNNIKTYLKLNEIFPNVDAYKEHLKLLDEFKVQFENITDDNHLMTLREYQTLANQIDENHFNKSSI